MTTSPPPIPLHLPGPAVVVLLGAAGSGKSTAARRLHPQLPIVSSDACRAELTGGDPYDQTVKTDAFQLLHSQVRDHCQRQQSVVVDATNTDPHGRAALVTIAQDHAMTAVAIVLDIPLQVCQDRQTTRPGPPPGKRYGARVPADVVVQQHYAIAHALPELASEGFHQVSLLRGDRLIPAPPALALRLALARTDAGYSQREVSHHTGIPRTSLSTIENGNQAVTATQLADLARLYRRPAGWFLGETPNPGLPLNLTGLTQHQRDLVHRFVDFLRHDQLITCGPQDPGDAHA